MGNNELNKKSSESWEIASNGGAYREIMKCAGKLAGIGFPLGAGARILLRKGVECFATAVGADFSAIGPEDIVDLTWSTCEAKRILFSCKDLNAMIIADTPYAGVCYEVCYEMPAVLDDMAQIVGPKVRFVEPDMENVGSALKKAPAVMTDGSFAYENAGDDDHVVVACGRTLDEAYTCLLVTEKNAEIFMRSRLLGCADAINPFLATFEHLYYVKKYSRNEIKVSRRSNKAQVAAKVIRAAVMKSEWVTKQLEKRPAKAADLLEEPDRMSIYERKKREGLVEYGKKLLADDLVQGTWGNLSVRLDDDWMLCTPSGIGYEHLKPEEIVKVNIDDLSYTSAAKNIRPTSEKSLHAAIYRSRDEVGAIVHTHSKCCATYAACEEPLEMPDGTVLKCAGYALSGSERLAVNTLLALGGRSGALMAHHGMIAVGRDLETAYQYACDMEEFADAVLTELEQ